MQHSDAFLSSMVHGTRDHGPYLAMISNCTRRKLRLFITNFDPLFTSFPEFGMVPLRKKTSNGDIKSRIILATVRKFSWNSYDRKARRHVNVK